MPEKFPPASIIIATYNNREVLHEVLNAMLMLDYPADFEIVVASDGSKDGTAEMMQKDFGKEKNIKFLDLAHQGVCATRNAAIKACSKKSEIVVNMDHDCVPEQEWLKKMIAPFENPKVGVVSGYNYYGGTSTAFRREPLDKVGGYDLDYNYYREDTDLSFKIMDLGYDFVFVPDAKFEHLHEIEKPKGILGTIKHVLKRLRYHENDALLYKKHPTKVCGEFLGIHFGFLVSPMADFRVATGTWHKGGRLKLSSPRGITFLENKSFFHLVLIASFGIFYVVLVKLFRFLGSLKFGRLVL